MEIICAYRIWLWGHRGAYIRFYKGQGEFSPLKIGLVGGVLVEPIFYPNLDSTQLKLCIMWFVTYFQSFKFGKKNNVLPSW